MINILNVQKHDIVNAEALRGRGIPVLEMPLATGDGAGITRIGFGLPAFHEAPDFTSGTSHNADPKSREFVDHPAALEASRAIGHLGALSSASQAIASDTTLSATGRAQKLKEATAKTIGSLGTLAAAIEPHDARLRATEAKLLATPEADHSATILDNESRKYWTDLDSMERQKLFVRLGHDPALDRVLVALKRSPVPLGSDSPKVDAAWRAMVARTKPQEWKAYSDEREATTWATELVSHLAGRALNPLQRQGGERVPREEVYKILKPAGDAGLRLGNFQPHEIGFLEHRLAAAAAAVA